MRRNGVMIASGVILVAMVALGAWNVVRVIRDEPAPTIVATMIPAEQPATPLLLEPAYVTALARANQWSNGALLSFAGLQADWPLEEQEPGPPEIPPGGWVRFSFIDPDRAELLSILIERYTGQIVTEEIQPWSDYRPTELPLGGTAVTSGDALRIAEAAIGQEFRRGCPVDRHRSDVILVAGQPGSDGSITSTGGTPAAEPGTPEGTPITIDPAATVGVPGAATQRLPVRWLVVYRDDRQSLTNAVEIEIGARDGQILRFEDRSVPCG